MFSPSYLLMVFTFKRGESNHLDSNKPHRQSIHQEGEHQLRQKKQICLHLLSMPG